MKEIVGKKILIIGFGREGQATLRFLKRHYPDMSISIADKAKVDVDDAKIDVFSGEHYLDAINNFETVIRTPSLPAHSSVLENYSQRGGHVTTQTNLFFAHCKGTVIGITGTKGKSTTTSIIYEILKNAQNDVRLVGNIGVASLDQLEEATSQTYFVMELSSHQLEDCRYSPHVAVVLPMYPEHLDYYHNFDHYVQAKLQIVTHQTSQDIVVYNQDYVSLAPFSHTKAKKHPYSFQDTTADVWVKDNDVWLGSDTPQKLFSLADIPLKGPGNRENCVAAVTALLLVGITKDLIIQGLRQFKTLPHRLEPIGAFAGIDFYNDSLATIPQATIHALVTLGSRVETLIAGGYNRGLQFASLGEHIAHKTEIATLILFPDTGEQIWKAVVAADPKTKIKKYSVDTMPDAVKKAFLTTHKGKTCLLSPASASFNLFKDYADRGEQFKKYVKKTASQFESAD